MSNEKRVLMYYRSVIFSGGFRLDTSCHTFTTKRAVYKFVELFEQNSSSLTSTFRKLDNDHSGEFEFEEFKSALAELQMAPNDVDLIARHYFKAAGAHDAGKSSPSISINEFMKQLSNDSVLLIGQHRK